MPVACDCCARTEFCRCGRERCSRCKKCRVHCDDYTFEAQTPAINPNIPRCRGCNAQIRWIKTPKGKTMPQNLDGSPHWSTCPNAKDFHKKNRAQQNS